MIDLVFIALGAAALTGIIGTIVILARMDRYFEPDRYDLWDEDE